MLNIGKNKYDRERKQYSSRTTRKITAQVSLDLTYLYRKDDREIDSSRTSVLSSNPSFRGLLSAHSDHTTQLSFFQSIHSHHVSCLPFLTVKDFFMSIHVSRTAFFSFFHPHVICLGQFERVISHFSLFAFSFLKKFNFNKCE